MPASLRHAYLLTHTYSHTHARAQTSRLQLFDRDLPLYSEARVLPPSVLRGARVADSLVGDACRVDKGSVVRNSVLGSCTYVERDCYIEVM
jgi:ADP-glucose pyrophosphorylase